MSRIGIGILIIGGCLAVAAVVAWRMARSPKAIDPSDDTRPNFVVIVLDDADMLLFGDEMLSQRFPNIARLAREGMTFGNCHVTTPICAPSRASFFRGDYARRTAVKTNDPRVPWSNGFTGSYSEYLKRGADRDDLAVWLKNMGYQTFLVGKYLHNHFDFRVPPGWDQFYCSLGNHYFRTHRFTTREDPKGRKSQLAADDYRTRVESDEAAQLVRHAARKSMPFFLYLAPLAPHEADRVDMRVEPCYRDLWSDMTPPTTPNMFEEIIGDKATTIAHIEPWNEVQKATVRQQFLDRARSIKSVDDMVGQLFETLEQTGELENTYIILTSDHGFHLGQHRLVGKCLPYSAATQVPLIVRGPGVAAVSRCDALIAHIDVAPTLVELAGGTIDHAIDGVSFVAQLRAADPNRVAPTRSGVLIEQWESVRSAAGMISQPFSAWRTRDELYIEWSDGSNEYYDLQNDPWELENRWPSLDVDDQSRLAQALRSAMPDFAESPYVSVVSPNYVEPPCVGARPKLFGYADAEGGVDDVAVLIRNTADDQYWDGVNWQSAPVKLPADVARPSGLITRWTYQPADQASSSKHIGEWEVSAVVRDRTGNESTPKSPKKFLVDSSAPNTLIQRPINNSTIYYEARLSGTASENLALSHVGFALKDLITGRYWTRDGWHKEFTSVRLGVRKDGRWHVIIPLPPGRYAVWVQAVDAAGNADPSPSSVAFQIGVPQQNRRPPLRRHTRAAGRFLR